MRLPFILDHEPLKIKNYIACGRRENMRGTQSNLIEKNALRSC